MAPSHPSEGFESKEIKDFTAAFREITQSFSSLQTPEVRDFPVQHSNKTMYLLTQF